MQPDTAADKLENGLDGIIPNSNRIVDILFGQIESNVGRVILPFLRLFSVRNTESEPPGDTEDGVGKQVGRGTRVSRHLRRLDLGFHSREIARLSSDRATVLLVH